METSAEGLRTAAGPPGAEPRGLSLRLLHSEHEIDETLPLALAAHRESRHHRFPLDPERRRRFLAARLLAERNRYALIVARHRERPVGMLTCVAENLYYTDVTVVSCLAFYVLSECRHTLLGGRVAVKLLHAARHWAMNRRAAELQIHVTNGVHIAKTDRMLRKLGLRQTGGNYTMNLTEGTTP